MGVAYQRTVWPMLRLLSATALVLALPAAAQGPRPPLLAPARIKADIATLAADRMKGRGPGQAGEPMAAEFIAARFKSLGLQPVNGSYLQRVPLLRWQRTSASFSLNAGGRARTLAPGVEIAATSRIIGDTRLDKAGVVFVGYGVVEPSLGYDPYAGVDVRGKVVVALAGDPDVEAGRDLGFGGRASSPAARIKLSEAEKRGAAAFLTIHETFPASYPWSQIANGDRLDTMALETGTVPPAFGLRGNVRQDVGKAMLKAAGLDYQAVKRAAQRADFRGSELTGVTLTAAVTTRMDRITGHNVLGVLPGSDRADETVLYGAHYDANGENAWDPPADLIRNGAIDNATGTATLLEIARAYAAAPKPRRSVVFAAWTAEEKGLLGASWYAANPPRPLATTAAVFNLDPHVVLGRTRNLELIGVGRTPLEDDLRRVAAAQGLAVEPEENTEAGWYFRSDHYALALKGVPTVYFRAGRDLVAGGRAAGERGRDAYNARCYHQTCDEFDVRWDLTGAAQEGSVAYALGREIADGNQWPEWSAGQPLAAERAKSAVQRRTAISQ